MRIWLALGMAAFVSSTGYAKDIVLFDGKDLSGWEGDVGVRGGKKPEVEDIWSVKDGLLHCSGGTNPWSWLHTVKDYTNFRLHLEWRWGEPDPEVKKTSRNVYNSGVFLRAIPWSSSTPQMPMPATFEAQILPPSEDTGDIWLMGNDHPNFKGDRPLKRLVTQRTGVGPESS